MQTQPKTITIAAVNWPVPAYQFGQMVHTANSEEPLEIVGMRYGHFSDNWNDLRWRYQIAENSGWCDGRWHYEHELMSLWLEPPKE